MARRNPGGLFFQAGFTLLEIIVVLAFIALLISMSATGLRIFNAGRSPEIQANRVAALLQLASDEAILTGTEIGLLMDKNQMKFYRFDIATQQWESFAGAGQLGDRKIPDGITAQLELDGVAVNDFQLALGKEATDAKPVPQLIFFSSGEATAFRLELTDETDRVTWQVEGNILGQFDVAAVNQF